MNVTVQHPRMLVPIEEVIRAEARLAGLDPDDPDAFAKLVAADRDRERREVAEKDRPV